MRRTTTFVLLLAFALPARAAALAVALAATVALAYPGCLADPYAHLDPRLTALWLANVSEARSLFSVMRDLPHEMLAYYGLPAAGLALVGRFS